MLVIQSKLIDIKTNECVGVICLNEDTSVPLSLSKAKELGVEDIDIIQYLDVINDKVVLHPRRKGFYGLVDKASGYLSDYSDVPYENFGSLEDLFLKSEIIWGYSFRYLDFIELDNSIAIQRALSNAEALENYNN